MTPVLQLDIHTLPEPQREALLRWTLAPEFQLLVSLCKHRLAVALSEHGNTLINEAEHVIRSGPDIPKVDGTARRIAEWAIVATRLQELQAQIADSGKAMTIGHKFICH